MKQDNLRELFSEKQDRSDSDSDILEDVKKVLRTIDFALQSDYDFYKGIRDESTEEEFEEFCKEFPEARMVLEGVGEV